MNTKPLVTIYSLSSSEDGVVRYIGQTTGRLDKRLSHHHYDAKKLSTIHKSNWIRSVIERGFEIVISPIEEGAIWGEAEIKWIKFYRDNGHDLVNTTDGGEGVVGYVRDAAWRKRRSDLVKGRASPNKGKKASDETRAKISAVQTGKKLPEETKRKLSESLKGRPKSEETKAKMKAAQQARAEANRKPPPTEEELAAKAHQKFLNLSARSKGKKLDDSHKNKISNGLTRSYEEGRRSAMSKLNDDQVRDIRFRLSSVTTTQKDLAKEYGVTESVISEIKTRKSYRHVK